MGIHGLTKLLGDNAPKCIKEQNFNNYFGRKVAVDASMHIYQFLAVVGRQGDQLLSNEAGEVTSHLQGMFYRTARMLEAGELRRAQFHALVTVDTYGRRSFLELHAEPLTLEWRCSGQQHTAWLMCQSCMRPS